MRKKECIVVVDDQPEWTMMVVKILRRAGFRAEGAFSGAEGLKLIKELSPDALLLDLDMPDINGYEVLSELARLDIATRVIVVSALPFPWKEAVRSVRLGACDYLLKEEVGDHLISRVNRALVLDHASNLSLRRLPPSVEKLVNQSNRFERENRKLKEELSSVRKPVYEAAVRLVFLVTACTIGFLFRYFGALDGDFGLATFVLVLFGLLLFPVEKVKRFYAKTFKIEAEVETQSGRIGSETDSS